MVATQLRNHIQPEIGDTKLADLSARKLTDLVDKLKDEGSSVPTVRRVMGALTRTLQHAVSQDMVASNIARGIRVTGKRGEGVQKIVPPTKDDLAAVLRFAASFVPDVPRGFGEAAIAKFLKRAAESNDLALRIRFAAATGLRASEQWALRWRHIDLDTRAVLVETRVDAFGDFDTTKSEAGKRTIPLSKILNEELAARRSATKFKGADDFVFPSVEGGFTRHTMFIARRWKPLLAKAEVKDFGWHALRHFAVSTWIEAGLQPKAVQTLAGHSTYSITMNRYGHMFPSDDHAAAMDKVAAALYAD
nr:site-specific integrase [Mesorhizobium sp.]